MKMGYLYTGFVLITASVLSADCEEGLLPDCNGNCVPIEYLLDGICDDGTQQEYPPGSGYFIDFSCSEYFCDVFNCSGCEGGCQSGFFPDCNGNCIPVSYALDGICDVGQQSYNGIPVLLVCAQYGCDFDTCSGNCNGASDLELDDFGACCLGSTCSELTREDCWIANGYFIGDYTLCQSNTCGCGEDWVADCNGNCIPYDRLDGGFCSHGEVWDFGEGEFTIDLDCAALACGLSACLGVCPGGCCTGTECIEMDNYQSCLDVGGIFLGSYENCAESEIGACAEQQKPIQLPDTEIEWSGTLGSVSLFPQWVASKGDILIGGGVHLGDDGAWNTAICVFRYDNEWSEDALLIAPTGLPLYLNAAYATDGDRIVVSSYILESETTGRNAFDIFLYDELSESWTHEQTIDNGRNVELGDYEVWGDSVDIDGDVLVIGDPGLVIEGTEEGGTAELYRFDGEEWILTETFSRFDTDPGEAETDLMLGMSVAVEGDTVVLSSTRSLWVYDISGEIAVGQRHIADRYGNSHAWHRSIDINEGRIMGNVVFEGVYPYDVLASPIYEFIDDEWTKVAILHPFDVSGSDGSGYIVELDGDSAIITSPNDNDLGHQTGSAYVWKFVDEEWMFQAKLWSDRAVGEDQFGIAATLHGGSAFLSGVINETEGDNIKEFWPRGIAWVNPLGGDVNDATNWDPEMPTTSDSVSISLRTTVPISVNTELPFRRLFIGPGTAGFSLHGGYYSLGDGGETINLQGVPGVTAEIRLNGGTVAVDGEVHIGEGDLPGKVALVSDAATGQIGKLLVDGYYLQHDAGELLLELQEPFAGQEAMIQLSSVAPHIDGVLSLNLSDGYVPQDGDIIPLLSSEVVEEDSGQFSMIIVNDPLPDGLYIKLNYETASENTNGTISAEFELLSTLFGYGDPSSGSVTGIATDMVLTDLGSSSRTLDGNDDIAVTTTDALHVFLSDGNGGIASQVSYPGFSSLEAIDAGDLDGDGVNDLVVVSSSTNTFIPIMNPSQDISLLSIEDPVSTGPNPTDVLVMNTDTDSDEDVIIVCKGYTTEDGQLDFFESEPSARILFNLAGSLLSPGNPGKINPGDVNNDKDSKIYVSFGSSNSAGMASGGSGVRGFNWAYVTTANVAFGPTNIVVGDLNGDLIDDVVVACPESDVLTLLTGVAGDGLSNPLYLNVGQEPTSIELLDFDNDGDKDIAVIASDPESNQRVVMMYRNDTSNNGGNLMFANDAQYDAGLNPILVAKGDIDGDGHDDLVSITESVSLRGVSNGVLLRKSESEIECAADFDSNGEVNILDLLEIIGAWGATDDAVHDLNGDGTVTVLDLLILIAAWGPC